ncbi:hypothetical protein BDA96_01G339800 [Sorghum bicolor]|uniref:Glutathione S-transferase n=2 Tax=Sorghum bicolor TaxID=4558 RepID=C5WUH3_SORBI|nr:probable glutathione S-transferase GSTU6 [Sorghum bicolor]EER94597.1 hypothetical protein SORBI_3001G317200 [Sorghum bicolor]KAG0550454.1 hypothetical protein BDA96_01G339800 [Sorghum bicolor]|eukprot:XP_002467599.1 probable glutathione S-transferase GSTU6 [Sorghum bicolor]
MAGGGGELKLLGLWTSPFVIRARLALNLKGLSYEYVEEDVKNKSQLLLASNPVHKKVPVLIHDGKPVCESQVIVHYIDEVFGATAAAGPSLLPADPYERATARFWAAYVDDKVGSAWRTMLFAGETDEKMDGAAQAIAALETLESAFQDCSKGKGYFGGDTAGYMDVVLGGYLGWFDVLEKMIGVRVLDAARTPLLAAWAERFRAGDAAEGILLQDVDKVLEFLKAFFA